jgi:hypothetical protein
MTPAFRWIARLIIVVAAPSLAAQQIPIRDNVVPRAAAGTGVISGIVMNDKTGQPVRRALVTASSTEAGVRTTAVTDETGTFAIKELPAGRFYLGAMRPGFVSANYGAKRPNRPGSTINLTEGEGKTGIALRLQPGGVITGTVRHPSGEPMPGVRVSVLRSTFGYDTGERTLAPISGGFGVATDDRGMYRVYGLAPDDYFVVVSPGIGSNRNVSDLTEITAQEMEWAARQLRSPGSPLTPPPAPGPAVDGAPMFFPGVARQANATVVPVKAGEERTGIDVVLAMIPTAKLTGSVVANDGNLPATLQVNVIAHDTIPGIPFSGFGTARVDKDGKFVSAGLPPGDYTVTVRVGGGGRGAAAPTAAQFGMTTVSINGSDVDTVVRLESGVTVSGRLVFDSTTTKPPADMTRVRVNLTAVRSRTPTLGVPAATADATGAFTFKGVTPGRYRFSASGAAGTWQMRSAMAQGRDALDVPITIGGDDVTGVEISFTDRPTEVSGTLLDVAGQPAPEYFIVVFPTDKTYWTPQSRRIQSVRPASDGRFRVPNLPPGDYMIAAVTDVEQGEWYDPSFLAQLVDASAKITLAEGEKKVQNLKIGG